jgi:hypothetical protein
VRVPKEEERAEEGPEPFGPVGEMAEHGVHFADPPSCGDSPHSPYRTPLRPAAAEAPESKEIKHPTVGQEKKVLPAKHRLKDEEEDDQEEQSDA